MNHLFGLLLQIDTTSKVHHPPYPVWLIYSLWVAAGVIILVVIANAILRSIVKKTISKRRIHSKKEKSSTIVSSVVENEVTLRNSQKGSLPQKPIIDGTGTEFSTGVSTSPRTAEESLILPGNEIRGTVTESQKKKGLEYKAKASDTSVIVLPPLIEVQAAAEEQSSPKYIGYNPLNIFFQSEPCNYPIVFMPNPACVIKFPRKGRIGRKGYKEAAFLEHVHEYFHSEFQIYDDRFVLIKNADRPLEPDITLIDEKNGINLFIDIEIDEPYEGINDISKRKATHYAGSDTNRNNSMKSRGWITIRFAEIQVHQQPASCCLFIADVIRSVNPAFIIPAKLKQANEIREVRQWTKDQGDLWSRDMYREKYLGITNFGMVPETERLGVVQETALGDEIEDKVIDEPPTPQFTTPNVFVVNPVCQLFDNAIRSGKYIACICDEQPTIIKPISIEGNLLNCHCYVKNTDRQLQISRIKEAIMRDAAFAVEAKGPSLGVERIKEIVQTAIRYRKYIRIRYTKRAWPELIVDDETGKIHFLQLNPSEVSIRTISNVHMAADILDVNEAGNFWINDNYITAYCNLRDEQRTFKFNRISEIAILNI